MRLEDLPREALSDLVEDLADLRHDLGKYIIFETRFIEDRDDIDALRAALARDLLQTHERKGKPMTCWQVWERLRPPELAKDPDVVAIERLLSALKALDLADDGALPRARTLAADVAEATRRLYQRATDQLHEEEP